MKIRIAIREQLAAFVIFTVLVSLAIVSIPTWIYVNNFVVGVETDGLALAASLKAARISSEIDLIQTTVQTISTRLLLQNGLINFYNRNASSDDPWDGARDDLSSALSTGGFSGLLQARLYSRNSTGDRFGLLNITGNAATDSGPILLPDLSPTGSKVYLGDPEYGFPPSLYPNLTYVDLKRPNQYQNNTNAFSALAFPSVSLGNGSDGMGILLGPMAINSTFALISISIPIRRIHNYGYILGYLTIVATAKTLVEVQLSREGLGNTGIMLFIGSVNPWNHFDNSVTASNASWSPNFDDFQRQPVQFLLPPQVVPGQADRHDMHSFNSGRLDDPFSVSQFPAVLDAFYNKNTSPNNATSDLTTTNEQGRIVAVGVARPQTSLVTWAVVVEQDESEAFHPMNTLRNILLGCVFGTAGLVLVLVIPCAHLSVMPIRRLKSATEKSIAPPGYEDEFEDEFDEENPSSGTTSGQSEKGFIASVRRRIRRRRRARMRAGTADSHRRAFKIPARVDDRKHYITDELTELTETFNEMTDELLKQYTSLDEKVAERTRELEISKKAAEAANESKTLFIANISHELKTPLNGIMGMCAVCMEEDDIDRIKQSLKTLYKSGDLLLHLLEDLLSFSKNQIGQQISLEEREFRLGEIRSQMLAIFDKQVRENGISFSVNFVGSDSLDISPGPDRTSIDRRLPALGPPGIGRLKDMCLWGDQHRILQVIINLVSNSLKFTPAGGKVNLRIRCLGEFEQPSDESRTSSLSRGGSGRLGRSRHRVGSGNAAQSWTALTINPLDPKATPHVRIRERSPTPPPPNAKSFLFEFEVEDTGPGIAEHMQEKIFEPFVQGDLGLSKKFGGTGLGLSICSQLATIMGGSISLKSTVGVGTTFTMQIPLKYVKDRASSTASSSIKSRPASVGSIDGETVRHSLSKTSTELQQTPTAAVLDKQPRLVGLSQPFFAANPNPQLPSREDQLAAINRAMKNKPSGQGKLRVLVADDNSTNIEVVSRLLKLEEIYDVTIAKDGQEAYDLVKANMENNQRFDVIFMDIQMPNLDGLQSTRLIRKMGYSAPIVALTAFSEESNVKECMESGMDEFLSKPIRRPALKQVLKKFATIEEEPEIASLTRKTTPENAPEKPDGNGVQAPQSIDAPASKSNGVAPPAPSTATA
ncbi:hypothetical protein B0T26DRAFT_738972 [Lasiosphaeria miniovina]|uniref:histidine kinase n=1 Tax=Lasiosphaeria miniovina TaxID=1954250 RepID=A0AA40B6Q7_9PEZI|nr:uncharacterized protein B0T26DRAFT_738972 [Lasiosphaeria miniovina]KAK0728700.1 hypothetical protein B0T26DRAFT_738972 [Lasiosphaeria miniovina]